MPVLIKTTSTGNSTDDLTRNVRCLTRIVREQHMAIEMLKTTVRQYAKKGKKIIDVANAAKDRDELLFNNMNAKTEEGNYISGTIMSDYESEEHEEDSSASEGQEDVQLNITEEHTKRDTTPKHDNNEKIKIKTASNTPRQCNTRRSNMKRKIRKRLFTRGPD